MPTSTKPKTPKTARAPRVKSSVNTLPSRAKTTKPYTLPQRSKPSGPYILPSRSKTPVPYMEAVGRRKTAIARVRATAGTKTTVTVNGKTVEKYFGIPSLLSIVMSPLSREGFPGKYTISVHVRGGGIHAQAEAIRHGLSRILVAEDATQKKELKKMGFLKRDSRQVERKHFGLKKARKRKQWKKR